MLLSIFGSFLKLSCPPTHYLPNKHRKSCMVSCTSCYESIEKGDQVQPWLRSPIDITDVLIRQKPYFCRVVVKLFIDQPASHPICFLFASKLEYWQLSQGMFSCAKQKQWLIMITKTWNPIISSCILLAPTMVPFYSAPL